MIHGNAERNKAIVRAILDRKPLAAVAREHGISATRCREIYHRTVKQFWAAMREAGRRWECGA